MEEEEQSPPYVLPANSMQQQQLCSSARIMSPEIVEIGEDSISVANSRDGGSGVLDIYVAVGKDDLHVLKWVLDHAISPGTRVFLVHVFPPLSYIPTPVGRLSRNQLSQDQVRFYINEEHNRRRNLLQKYIRLCNDAKVTVDTMLLESNETAKAIVDLIPILNIINLVIGATQPPRSRLLRKKIGKAEFVKKNAPEYCKVTIVDDGKKIVDVKRAKQVLHSSLSSTTQKQDITRNPERKFFECVCFSGKFN